METNMEKRRSVKNNEKIKANEDTTDIMEEIEEIEIEELTVDGICGVY